MARISPTVALLAGAIVLGASSSAQAEATGPMLANTCAGCHGTNGQSVGPASPIIAGINRDVFVDMMKGYQSGDIYSTIMGRIAKGYTDDEIEAMADFFNAKPFQPAAQEYEVALVDSGARLHDQFCENCHAEGGTPLRDEDTGEDEEDFYLLAGQWTPYLAYTMSDFREDRRQMPRKMREKLDELLAGDGEDGLAAIFAFYASQQ
ncbi:cytochrome c4 [Thiocapsa imhoffii]|uniref:Cytochrome c4 n=1 Tax=Thiocapsa imhoffii TaxID=382777 RepID=A0A9X0WK02_9GAMM|nr:c-type cytochrome [Thiocapsa imhoffii]MBK1645744.1 cytochrome c4 [Thiocapsa imhoffii]